MRKCFLAILSRRRRISSRGDRLVRAACEASCFVIPSEAEGSWLTGEKRGGLGDVQRSAPRTQDPRLKTFAQRLLLLAVAIIASACNSGGSVGPFVNPPAESSLNPNSTVMGSGGFTLTVNGSNFMNGAVVQWNGSPRTTMFVTSSQLTAQINSADVASSAAVPVTVQNPDLQTSNAINFGVNAPNVPNITSLQPTNVNAGSGAFVLTVNGTNFSPSSIVQWGGAARTTTFVSSAKLTANITAADVQNQGQVQVTVNTPGAGGGTSNQVAFNVNPNGPVPVTISGFSFSPRDLTVNPGQTVTWTNNDVGVQHTVTRDITTMAGPSSPVLNTNDTYSFTVPAATPSGTNIFYHCTFHGTAGDGTTFGAGMSGVIRVR